MCDPSNNSLLHVLHVKLDLVKSQTQELQASLESFISKISSDVTAMAAEKLPGSRIGEINSRLDSSLALLMGKWTQFNDIIIDETVEDLHLDTAKTPVSAEQKELLAGIPELIQRVEKLETEIVKIMNHQQTKETDIQAAQLQILRIEEDLKTEAIEKLNSEKENNSRFESLNNRVKVLENDDRLSSLEKQFHLKLENSDVKEHETRLNTIGDLIQTLQMNCSDVDKMVQKQNDEVKTLKKSVCDINHRQDRLESTSDNLSDYLSSKVETAMDRLAMTKEEGKYERDVLNEKFSVFESKRQTDAMKLKKLDSLFKQVCNMISTKVNPLCHLQDILSKHHATLKTGNNIHATVKATVTTVNSLLPRVQKLELGTGKSSMGFTAYFHSQINVTKGSSLKFTDVRYNGGNLYSSVTGIFTATHEGVYLAAVTLNQSSEGSVFIQIIQKQKSISNAVGKVVCKAETNDNCVNSCGIGIAKLNAGDVVFVTVKDAQGNVSLSGYSSFSCVLIT